MWVVKLGGSLQTSVQLTEWLRVLAEYGAGKVIIVPGGGQFADQVRAMQSYWGFDDSVAHKMALRAMEQYAYMLQGIEPRLWAVSSSKELLCCVQTGRLAVWLPYNMTTELNYLPASWQVTSDSLALWLADYLQADYLALIKSTKLPDDYLTVVQLVERGMLDDYFPDLMARVQLPIIWFERNEYMSLAAALQGKAIHGNRQLHGTVENSIAPPNIQAG